MYASSIDHAIAESNNMPYRDVKESLRKSTAEQLLLSLTQKTPAVSLAHHQDSANKMLNYIYNSIGFKYDLNSPNDFVQSHAKAFLKNPNFDSYTIYANENLQITGISADNFNNAIEDDQNGQKCMQKKNDLIAKIADLYNLFNL